MKRLVVLFLFACMSACGGGGGGGDGAPPQQEIAELGRLIFFDTRLSDPAGVACASCHNPAAGFSDPRHGSVSPGAVSGTHGTRNAPMIMYSLYSPVFGFSEEEEDYVGGQFHDGSAVDLREQAGRPFFGKVEMNLADHDMLRDKIMTADYIDTFTGIFGKEVLLDSDQTLAAVTRALAAFERSEEFQPFSSKYDAWAAGQVKLTEQEMHGMRLFNEPNKGNCAACHPSTSEDGSPNRALFTDFTYDNLGLPANGEVTDEPDIGLAGSTGRPSDTGRFKVPTLRNVEISGPYFHHGLTGSLKEVVHFYNARDVDSSIAAPEFPDNMNIQELGNLGLTDQEEDDIVAFLLTLTDGYR